MKTKNILFVFQIVPLYPIEYDLFFFYKSIRQIGNALDCSERIVS